MADSWFLLRAHPWLFSFTFMLATIICFALVILILVAVFDQPQNGAVSTFLTPLLGNGFLIFLVVPFVMGFMPIGASYRDFLDEIRLSRLQPLGQLLLLGLTCYILLALSQILGSLVYRISQGQPVDLTYFRSAFPLTSELPPHSLGWLTSFPSVLEEVAFRGVILALFLRFYTEPRAILFSAILFGLMHLLNLLGGREFVWVVGQVLWASILGLFYGFVTLRSGSLLPGMIVHYLGNLFVASLTATLQKDAPIPIQSLYGVLFSFGIVPTILMVSWTRYFVGWWMPHP